LQCSVAISALFPALPLPSIIKLNTGRRIAACLHFAQMETARITNDIENIFKAGATISVDFDP